MRTDRVQANNSMAITEEMDRVDEGEISKEVTITIHTYGDEVYSVKGIMEILQEGTERQETIMAVQGSIEKVQNAEGLSVYEQLEGVPPTSLTVYMENKIWGFYSTHELLQEENSEGTDIVYYGYLVGYADGENYYSS